MDYRYDAFGNLVVSNQYAASSLPRFTFSTKEYLAEAQLYLYAYRVYDPVAGRWTQRDPIDYQDSVNLYQFCGNNPVNKLDPFGLADKDENNKLIVSGTEAFKEKANAAIAEIESTPGGKELIDSLRSGSHYTRIEESPGKNTIMNASPTKSGDKTGSDCVIYWNPTKTTGGTDSSGSKTRPPFVGLAHEMGHAQESITGTAKPTDYSNNTPGTTPPCEVNALRTENAARSGHHLPLRPFYFPERKRNNP